MSDYLPSFEVKYKTSKLGQIALFIAITIAIAVPLFFLTFTGWSYGTADKWILIALNVVFLALFLLFLPLKKKIARLPNSVYLAFILALYVEMYGVPLTMFLFAGFFGQNNVFSLEFLLAGVIGQETFYRVFNAYIFPLSKIIMGIGILLIIYGWKAIYKARKEGKLVTTGLYGVIRNPQYVGFLLITLGLNVMWLTMITLILWPILALLYWRLSKREDKDMEEAFGQEFIDYKKNVPGFIPRLRNGSSSLEEKRYVIQLGFRNAIGKEKNENPTRNRVVAYSRAHSALILFLNCFFLNKKREKIVLLFYFLLRRMIAAAATAIMMTAAVMAM